MISYASLERFEGDFAVLEVEQLSIFESVVGDFSKECYMANVPVKLFHEVKLPLNTGTVYSVEHDGKQVNEVLRVEEAETNRRIEWLQAIGKKI